MESLAQKHASGQVKEISEQTFEAELYGGSNVKPDILIRTSNEIRLSNFLLYQSDDSQLQFIKVLWPDFTIWDFIKLIFEYQQV